MRLTRDQIIEITSWNAANTRARREYAEHPIACLHWCPECVQPKGTTTDCESCKAVRRMRRVRRA